MIHIICPVSACLTKYHSLGHHMKFQFSCLIFLYFFSYGYFLVQFTSKDFVLVWFWSNCSFRVHHFEHLSKFLIVDPFFLYGYCARLTRLNSVFLVLQYIIYCTNHFFFLFCWEIKIKTCCFSVTIYLVTGTFHLIFLFHFPLWAWMFFCNILYACSNSSSLRMVKYGVSWHMIIQI